MYLSLAIEAAIYSNLYIFAFVEKQTDNNFITLIARHLLNSYRTKQMTFSDKCGKCGRKLLFITLFT